MTFKRWMELVDDEMVRESSLTSMDIGDKNWFFWFEDGTSPKEAAQRALEDEGFYRFVYGS